jgi:hypothetical protein
LRKNTMSALYGRDRDPGGAPGLPILERHPNNIEVDLQVG